ncbi:MAG: hypothetical protein OXC93_04785, partial [Rhodospirillaceae bacterium]|nr:hypothetical protein [Rhodospirillaceae bacterium]
VDFIRFLRHAQDGQGPAVSHSDKGEERAEDLQAEQVSAEAVLREALEYERELAGIPCPTNEVLRA